MSLSTPNTHKVKLTIGAPERLWLSAADTDNEHEVWFDPHEGGTPYLRADLAQQQLACMTVHFHSVQDDLAAATNPPVDVERVIDAVMEVERYAPKTIPMGATAPLFNGMRIDNDGPWISRVDVAKRLRSALMHMKGR